MNEAACGITAFPDAMPSMTASPGFCQALIEHTGQAFFAYDTGSKQFTYLSPAFEAIFKIQAQSANSGALLALVHPEDRHHVAEAHAALLEREIRKSIEFRIHFPDQAEQWVCLTASLLEEIPGNLLIIGHAEDITAQRQYNDYLKKFSNKKNVILNILSHDLAGPFANIQNLSALLAEQMKSSGSEETHKIIRLIERSSKQGAKLIREFINQEFLESTQVELITRRINLVEKFREMLVEFQGAKGEWIGKRIDFLTSHEQIYAEIDDIKFLQVINNLISNALKFTPDGGVITVMVEEEKESVLVKVADTGVGIPEKYHATLFDKFTNARRPGLKGESSVGLGMSIIKTIVEWHRGEIWLESEENKGTTFYIRLPKD